MYYGYARVSTQGQNDTSIEVQLRFLRARADILNLPFEGLYEKASGKNVEGRAVFSQLLSTLKKGDILGVYDNSRLGRSTEENIRIIKTLSEAGIGVEISGKLIDTSNPQDELLFSIESSISTFQRKNQLLKSRAGMDMKKANGDWIQKGTLYGWDIFKKNGKTYATIEPNEAKNIQYLFQEYLKGKSFIQLAKEMKELQLPSEKNHVLAADSIRRILMRPLYMGYYTVEKYTHTSFMRMSKAEIQGKLVKSNIYPPIVSEELWWAVYDNWREIPRKYAKQFERRYSAYELSSFLRCAVCNKGFSHYYQKCRSTGSVIDTYVCGTHVSGCNHIPARAFKAYVMENIVKATFFLTFLSGIEVSNFFSEKRNVLLKETSGIRANIEILKNKLADNEKRRNRLLDLVEDGISDLKDIKDRIKKLADEKDDLETKIASLEKSILQQDLEIEDILKEESENVIEKLIAGDSTSRRDMYIKYAGKADVYEDRFEITYMNGKKFIIQHYPKHKKNVKPQKFRMFYRDELQAEGYIDGVNAVITFDKKDGDEFMEFSNKYYNELADKANEYLAVAKSVLVVY